MIKTAVLLTVFNRKDVTLQGLRSLYKAIEFLGGGYSFDIYMTDDGCTDGTPEAVASEFPMIDIVKGNGNLFWSKGMNLAWNTAIRTGNHYDYFLWFNDDSELYGNALYLLFNSLPDKDNVIITGAFCNREGKVSYGGKNENDILLPPNGKCQEVQRMNGNLVLIPFKVYFDVGIIDKIYWHGYGDYDYGYRAQRTGYKVLLTPRFVGVANRHDNIIPQQFSKDISLRKRWRLLHSPQNKPWIIFLFYMRHKGFASAIKYIVRSYLFTIFPNVYKN